MHSVNSFLQAGMKGIEVPHSIPRLTTRQVLTMSFVEGDPITRLKVNHTHNSIPQCRAGRPDATALFHSAMTNRHCHAACLTMQFCHPGC